MLRKPFSESNHKANDAIGKKIVIDFLNSKGVGAIENPDDYGIDIMAPVYEVERRTIKSKKWPYQTVHVPERKTKFLKPNTWYVVNIHHDLGDLSNDTLLFCSTKKIAKCPLVEVPNKSIPKGEYFYDVPLSFWKQYEANDG